ncbi:MAG: GtrA family protein [Oscillospiraceae bacterium]|jgi:putative flippase GtrA|nr:GtrA family protein [Oscillospiraceae bacterium]
MASNTPQGQTEFTAKENFWLTAKYLLVAASAGAIQAGSFELLSRFVFNESADSFGWSYFIALILSVLWNFTINRRYTFKSVANIPRAMLLVAAYYAVFTPLTVFGGNALVHSLPNVPLIAEIVLVSMMLTNVVTEYLYQRLVVFGKTINTNDLAQEKPEDGQE